MGGRGRCPGRCSRPPGLARPRLSPSCRRIVGAPPAFLQEVSMLSTRAVVLPSLFVLAVFGCSAAGEGTMFTQGAGAGTTGAGGAASTGSGLGAGFATSSGSGASTGSGTPGCIAAAELVYVLS